LLAAVGCAIAHTLLFWLLTVKDPFVVNKLALGKVFVQEFSFPVTSYHSADSLYTLSSGLASRQAKITSADEVLRNLLLLFHLSLGVGTVSPSEVTDPMDSGSPSSDNWTDNSILL